MNLELAKSLLNRAQEHEKIEFIVNSVVEEAQGNGVLEKLVVRNKITNEQSELDVAGCFVFVGLDPINNLIKDKVNLDDAGYVIAGEDMKTNIPGVFVAGDLRQKPFKTNCYRFASDGAIASIMAEKYIEGAE